MFFVISKVFWFVAQPVNLTLLLVVVGLVACACAWRRVGYSLVSAAALLLGLSVWSSLGANLLAPLEDRFARPEVSPENVAGIVVLGGGLEGSINRSRGGYELNSSGDRFVETAILARRFPDARILVSGGSGELLLTGESDADTAPRLLSALGVAPERLILENKSRNTDENARFSRELAKPQSGETWLLVTSAFHMPRSVGLFRKAGFAVVPWPVDYRTAGDEGYGFFVDNAIDSLQNTTLGIREWIGLLAYWLTGRIDQLLPGPA
ncbi:YdcF family protein [Mesorhizobium sp. 1B3]|uniref:YdcF family protein n=1 Tax=Mesorhizobium sp. 1B3 TaxID=3243599 RepID=UPI003D97ED91